MKAKNTFCLYLSSLITMDNFTKLTGQRVSEFDERFIGMSEWFPLQPVVLQWDVCDSSPVPETIAQPEQNDSEACHPRETTGHRMCTQTPKWQTELNQWDSIKTETISRALTFIIKTYSLLTPYLIKSCKKWLYTKAQTTKSIYAWLEEPIGIS